MNPIVIFTYAGDALPIRRCVRLAQVHGGPVTVVDDAHNPLPRHVACWLEDNGVHYWQSRFPRRGNLNGAECVTGMCDALWGAANAFGADSVIKLDSDTVILNPSRLTGNYFLTGERLAYGMCYSITKETARAVADYWRGRNDPTAPEDRTIWTTALCLCQPYHCGTFTPDGGPFSAVPEGTRPTQESLRRFDILTFGNQPPGGWRDRGLQVSAAMENCLLFGT